MANIRKSARQTVRTAAVAAVTAAEAVKTAKVAVKTARAAGSQAGKVAKQVVERVTGKEAARRKKARNIAVGVAAVAVVAGIAVARKRRKKS